MLDKVCDEILRLRELEGARTDWVYSASQLKLSGTAQHERPLQAT